MNQIFKDLRPYIDKIYDPPGLGNCGFYAIAAGLGMTSKDACFTVRQDLQQEIQEHYNDHLGLLTTESQRKRAAKSLELGLEKPKTSQVKLNDLIASLDCEDYICGFNKWLKTPDAGYAIASAYGRPFIIIDTSDSPDQGCHTFFPYRVGPDNYYSEQLDPIIVAFVDRNHFVELKVKAGFPFPTLYLEYASLQSDIPKKWIRLHEAEMGWYQKMFPPKTWTNPVEFDDV